VVKAQGDQPPALRDWKCEPLGLSVQSLGLEALKIPGLPTLEKLLIFLQVEQKDCNQLIANNLIWN
jgi:hypothetical protein